MAACWQFTIRRLADILSFCHPVESKVTQQRTSLDVGVFALFFEFAKLIWTKQGFDFDETGVLWVRHFDFLVVMVLVSQDFGVIGAAVLLISNAA